MNTTTAAIEAAAQSVAHALTAAARAGAAFDEASNQHQKIADRIHALDAERVGIVARRAAGDHRPDDGARLALIEADKQGLAGLEAEALATVHAARGPAEAAKRAVAGARMMLDREEAETTETALINHAVQLDALLLSTVRQIAEVGQRTGRAMPAWGPSAALAKELRALQARRREL